MFMKYSEEDQNTMALTQANINNIIDNYWVSFDDRRIRYRR